MTSRLPCFEPSLRDAEDAVEALKVELLTCQAWVAVGEERVARLSRGATTVSSPSSPSDKQNRLAEAQRSRSAAASAADQAAWRLSQAQALLARRRQDAATPSKPSATIQCISAASGSNAAARPTTRRSLSTPVAHGGPALFPSDEPT